MNFPTEIAAQDARILAQHLEPLTAVVLALVSEQGQLLHANHGCRRVLSLIGKNPDLTSDVSSFFVHPTLPELLSVHANPGQPIYEGIINVGDIQVHCRSLMGVVYRQGQQLLIVGEYDVAEMEMLNAQVIELNEQLSATQRDLARSNRKLQESEAHLTTLSLTDPLTGLANRRRLLEFLQTSMDRHRRYQEPFSIVMTDIDFFKKVNDGFGHDVGDEVLLAFSKLLQDNMRNVDLVARLGGEEFIVVMSNTALEQAVEKAEGLRSATEKLYFDSMQRGVTASFGVVEFDDADDVETLLKHVDEAVYASKHGGRNRVTPYDAGIAATGNK